MEYKNNLWYSRVSSPWYTLHRSDNAEEVAKKKVIDGRQCNNEGNAVAKGDATTTNDTTSENNPTPEGNRWHCNNDVKTEGSVSTGRNMMMNSFLTQLPGMAKKVRWEADINAIGWKIIHGEVICTFWTQENLIWISFFINKNAVQYHIWNYITL